MTTTRTIEVFSAGCAICEDTIALVNQLACPSCEVSVLDTREPDVAERAKQLGVRALPAVAIDGLLADCCKGSGIDEAALRAAGVGTPIT
ncbi:MAG: thioredoxin family protein [Sandaracinaceae bacterium]